MQPTKIDYLTHTWNPIKMRCGPVGPGCANCWHLKFADRHKNNPKFDKDTRMAYSGYPPVVTDMSAPLDRKTPSVIGTMFMGDLFHDIIHYRNVFAVFRIMQRASWHTFIVLTKRPERMNVLYPLYNEGYVPENIVIGVSVENQEMADKRIPFLCRTPAAKRFISIEPMLGPISLENIPSFDVFGTEDTAWHHDAPWNEYIHGVIVGGESGPGARPMHPDWIRSVRDECAKYNIPFYFKQWGKFVPLDQLNPSLCGRVKPVYGSAAFPGDIDRYKVLRGAVEPILDGQKHRDLCWDMPTLKD